MAKLLVILLEHLRSILYESMVKIKILENLAEKPPPLFCLFCERSDSCHTCGIPMVPIVQIHTQIPPIQISSIGYQLCQLFKYSHIQKYRTQYHGTGGRPIGSLTTIHNNIPAIPITLVNMAL